MRKKKYHSTKRSSGIKSHRVHNHNIEIKPKDKFSGRKKEQDGDKHQVQDGPLSYREPYNNQRLLQLKAEKLLCKNTESTLAIPAMVVHNIITITRMELSNGA